MRKLDEVAYDAAVVDMNLSEVEEDNSGGEQVLSYARALEDAPALIVCTAYDDPQFSADTLQEWGVARFVSKNAITQRGSEPLLHSIRTAIVATKPKRDWRERMLSALAGDQDERIWAHNVSVALGADGYPALVAFLDELFATLTPLIPMKGVVGPQLRVTRDGSGVVGCLWSKGIGAAIYVDARRAIGDAGSSTPAIDRADARPGEDAICQYSRNGIAGKIWRLDDRQRSAFGS